MNPCGTCDATVPDEVCGNDADGDRDGRVDENCVAQDMTINVVSEDAGMRTGRADMTPPQSVSDAAGPGVRGDIGSGISSDDSDARLNPNLDMGTESNFEVLVCGGPSGGCAQSTGRPHGQSLWLLLLTALVACRRFQAQS